MSITDAAAGGMTPQAPLPSHTFGTRQSPPPIIRPEPDHRLGSHLASLFQDWLNRFWRVPDWRVPDWLKSLAPRLQPGKAWSQKVSIRALLYSDFCATFPRLLAYLGALTLLAVGTSEIFRLAPVAAAIEPASRPEWIAVTKPFPAFALSMPELADAGPSYDIRRHATGGGRKDILTWGELSGAGPHLMVEIYRPGTEFTRFANATREIAARTDDLVAAKNIKPAEVLESKFGAMSLVEFTATPDGARQCLGFVRPFDRPHLQIAGWYCTSGPEIIERNVIACALDRLTLLAAGSDATVGELFARAELKRNFCGQKSLLLAATPKRGPGPTFTPKIKLRGHLSDR